MYCTDVLITPFTPQAVFTYNYPAPEEEMNDFHTIAILGTNDIHGAAFPKILQHPQTKQSYLSGGLEYLTTFIKTLRQDWGNRLLWLDAGDQYLGTVESQISNGEVINQFFQMAGLDATTLGNQDISIENIFQTQQQAGAKWDYIISNSYNKVTKALEPLPNTVLGKVFNVGKVKIGVIGLVAKKFARQKGKGSQFTKRYSRVITELAANLRANGANAIILNSHLGISCRNHKQNGKYRLKMWTQQDIQGRCKLTTRLAKLLTVLPPDTIDAAISGNIHGVVHHWVNNVPVIQSTSGGKYFNVLYLTFDARNKLVKPKTQIEGPVPVCQQILTTTNRCDLVKATTPGNMKPSVSFLQNTFHGRVITPDPELSLYYGKWQQSLAHYKAVLSNAEESILRSKNKRDIGSLENLITDVMRERTNSHIALINSGSIMGNIPAGPITVETIQNLFPFDDNVVSFEMTGIELKRSIEKLQAGKHKLYFLSGLVQDVTQHPKRLVKLQLSNNQPIDLLKTYTVTTTEFIWNGGLDRDEEEEECDDDDEEDCDDEDDDEDDECEDDDDEEEKKQCDDEDEFVLVKKWYQVKNLQNHGPISRLMINHFRNVPTIKTTDVQELRKQRIWYIRP